MAAKKPIGSITRGTTNPNRLRRVDRYISSLSIVRKDNPVVVDLGFGASPITAIELHARLVAQNSTVRVVGIEIDRDRVERALPAAKPGLDFVVGGFETPLPAELAAADVIRAFNVLRQYGEDEVAAAAGVTPYVLTQRLRDQLGGIRLRAGRPRGDEAWVEPTGDEEQASASSLALAPWVAARAAELRATWTEERWARAIGRRLPYEAEVFADFTGTGGQE